MNVRDESLFCLSLTTPWLQNPTKSQKDLTVTAPVCVCSSFIPHTSDNDSEFNGAAELVSELRLAGSDIFKCVLKPSQCSRRDKPITPKKAIMTVTPPTFLSRCLLYKPFLCLSKWALLKNNGSQAHRRRPFGVGCRIKHYISALKRLRDKRMQCRVNYYSTHDGHHGHYAHWPWKWYWEITAAVRPTVI